MESGILIIDTILNVVELDFILSLVSISLLSKKIRKLYLNSIRYILLIQ